MLEHAIKIIERILERRIHEEVNVDAMQFGFTTSRGMTDLTLFTVRRMQEYTDTKLYTCFVDIEKAFDRV